MTEIHKAKLVFEKGKPKIDVVDEEPLRSARLFTYVSDQIWERRPRNHTWADYSVSAVVPPEEAFALANETAGGIDPRLVLARSVINLGKYRSDAEPDVIIPSDTLLVPEAAWVDTFNWDARNTGRIVKRNGKNLYAQFVDGHRDYSRELGVHFRFKWDKSIVALKYVMQRAQDYQGEPTDLSAGVWYSGFAETGYESDIMHDIELTEEQETAMLTVMARIGGIALDSFED